MSERDGGGLVVVTGAGGLVGGYVARHLAASGRAVRGLVRRAVTPRADDPAIDWMIGDLLEPATAARAVEGATAVVHCAGWVSLGPDPHGLSHPLNVQATARLLQAARAAGVQSFVYTSTLYTLAAGTPEQPADESSPWNLHCVDSPYTRTKRAAEALVLAAHSPQMRTLALCPGMVLGRRDPKPTSSAILAVLARSLAATPPPGGIPIIDANMLAYAHKQALDHGEGGRRYAVVGPYLSYPQMAVLVREQTGRPRLIIPLPDATRPLLVRSLSLAGPWVRKIWPEASRALVEGGFLRLHVAGTRADRAFGLVHPSARQTIARVLAAGA